MFHPPPADLHNREPLLHAAAIAQAWYRSHKSEHDAVFFGRRRAQRWDAPKGNFGVLYLGASEYSAFMESIGRGVLQTRFIPASLLKGYHLTKIRCSRDLALVDFVTSGGLTRLGAEGSLANGLGYRNSQRWSEALRSHPARLDGIYYRSRFDPALTACALYDHCAPFIEVVEDCGTWADQPTLLGAILDHYEFGTDL